MTHPLQGTLENRHGAWVLTLARDIAHPAERVWPWLTDPDRLKVLVADRAGPTLRRRRCAADPRKPR